VSSKKKKKATITPEERRLVRLLLKNTPLPISVRIKLRTSFDMVANNLEWIVYNGTKKDSIRLQACYGVLRQLNYNIPLPIALLGGFRTGYYPWKTRSRSLTDRRRAVDYETCQFCGNQKWLRVHHRKPLSRGGQDRIENLITLCHNCHVIEHRRLRKIEKEGEVECKTDEFCGQRYAGDEPR